MHLINPKTKSKIKLIVFELFFIQYLNAATRRKILDMIAELKKSNVLVAVITCHTEMVLHSITDVFDIADLKICCDGALVKLDDIIVYRAAIPLDIANDIISVLISSADLIDLTVDSESYFYSMRPSTLFEQEHGYPNTVVTDFTDPIKDDAILRITPRLNKSDVAQQILNKTSGVYLVNFESERGFQFKSDLATKQNALKIICSTFQISFKNILYLGNTKSETEFLEFINNNDGYVMLRNF